MKKILCIGEALIDMICTDKGKPLSEGQNFLKKPGGAPTNVAAAIAAFGGQVSLSAKVGNDPFGHQLVGLMDSLKVDVQHTLVDPNFFTTMAFVSLMENGERDFVFSRGADAQLSLADVEKINISDYEIVHFGSATAFLEGPLQQAYDAVLAKALANESFISFDPNYRDLLFRDKQEIFIKKSTEYLSHCHFAKLSDEEAILITGQKNVDDAVVGLRKITNGIVCITIGKEGTLLSTKTTQKIVPSISVNVVDTTGAGDAFVGACLYQFSKIEKQNLFNMSDAELEKIIINANKAGARTCEHMGAMEAFIHLNNEIFN